MDARVEARKSAARRGSGCSLSVVVVDDVQEITAVIREWLSAAGHKVFIASSAAEAAALVSARSADVVIADVLMPEHDGLDLIRDLRRNHPATRILAISGGGRYMAGPDCLRLARGFGAHATLAKPFTEPQLMAAVRAAMAPEQPNEGYLP